MNEIQQYYCENEVGIEYIYCNDSVISYSKHNHVSVYVITLLLSGEIVIRKGAVSYKCKPNKYFIIKPYETHSISLKTDSYNMISVCINKKLINDWNIDKILLIIRNDLEYFFDKKLINCENTFLILGAIREIYLLDRSKNMDRNMNLLACYIQNNPEKDFNINQMSEKIYISKYHLLRKFKKEIGITPHKFQIQNKVRKAQQLLNKKVSITEVALEMGFYDQSHFIRHFKNIVGITPTEYIKSYVKLDNKK